MTVRVDTLDSPLGGSSSRVLPLVRSLSTTVLERFATWWQQRSELVMSDEWLQEHRWRDRS